MSRVTFVMAEVTDPEGEVEAEPVYVRRDGETVTFEVDERTISCRVDELESVLALLAGQRRAA